MEARWAARPFLTVFVRALAVALPVAAGLVAGALAATLLPEAHGDARIAWWIGVLGAATAATLAADALARRLLPLSVLLRLTLAFPDRAPSRLRVAMRATNIRRLRARIDGESHAALPASERAADIVAMAAALNAHDRRTRGHSERVQALTQLVAAEMHLDPEEQDRLGWAAFLHDIGKLEVPPSLLNKDGPPDDQEWQVLRRHPENGARLIEPLRAWLGDAAGAIGEHHEHYDGTGYPRGVAGEEISRAGRIVAVADAFETITAARAYKRAKSAADGRAELTRCAGTHFDPHVVRAFLGVSLGRLRWVIGFAGWVALIPVLGATRARAATLRPAWTGTSSGLAGAAVASLVLATAPAAAPPPHTNPPPAVSSPAGSPSTPATGPSTPVAVEPAQMLVPDTPAVGQALATPVPPSEDPSIVRVHVRNEHVDVVVSAPGGASVGPGSGQGTNVEIDGPHL